MIIMLKVFNSLRFSSARVKKKPINGLGWSSLLTTPLFKTLELGFLNQYRKQRFKWKIKVFHRHNEHLRGVFINGVVQCLKAKCSKFIAFFSLSFPKMLYRTGTLHKTKRISANGVGVWEESLQLTLNTYFVQANKKANHSQVTVVQVGFSLPLQMLKQF